MERKDVVQFEERCGELRTSLDAIVNAADGLRDLVATTQANLGLCNRTVAVLRRSEEPDMMGPLNSVSAVAVRHQSVGGALADLEAALARFEDVTRDLRLLHPSVTDALNQKLDSIEATRAATAARVAPAVEVKRA